VTPAIHAVAPAKVNLALHVTGRRPDGYHMLDSLVVFTRFGDDVTITGADTLALSVSGPCAAGVPTDHKNLVLRAATLLSGTRGAAIHLVKNLPHAAGIGGGSSDAATALLALADHWSLPLPPTQQILTLGADVPVCLRGRPTRMRGIGEDLSDVPPLPDLWVVLANPGVPVPTSAVFQALQSVDNPPMSPPDWSAGDAAGLLNWLRRTRNDLEGPARAMVPDIGRAIDMLNAASGCAFARMSGSGGTCFGLFTAESTAQDAAKAILQAEPTWWVQATSLQ